MKAIVWQERYSCNFRCPYCTIYKMDDSNRMKDPDRWIDALNKLSPEIIDITGGEPFLNPDLPKIINGLNAKIGLTTNLSVPILKFVTEVNPSKVISMTISYHPSQSQLTKDLFISRATLLRSRGFNINVNFVAYPEQLGLIPQLEQLFRANGIRFHVDPFAEDENNKFQYSEVEKEFLKMFIGQDREFRITDQKKNVCCSGGRDYLQVDPSGDAYRCMTHHLIGIKPIGNIFDENFCLNGGDDPCGHGDICGGCDRDKVTISEQKV